MKNKEIEKKEEVEEKVEKVVSKINITAVYYLVDRDNVRREKRYEGEGVDVAEALKALDFPRGTNCLVAVKVVNKDRELEKTFAPHKARIVLGEQRADEFAKLFREYV